MRTKTRMKSIKMMSMACFCCILPSKSPHAQMTTTNIVIIELVFLSIFILPTIYVMITGAPFVPTQMAQVDRMLKAAKIKPGMKVYDLGSGDGRLVHKAALDYKADAIGFEYSPLVWIWARFLALFWRSKAKLKFKNIWKADLKDADVIVCYLLPNSMKRLQKEHWPNLKKGTLIISHAFRMPDVKVWKELPALKDQRLGPVWIYKKS